MCQVVPGDQGGSLLVATVANSRSTLSEAVSYDLVGNFLTMRLRSHREFEGTDWHTDSSLISKTSVTQSDP